MMLASDMIHQVDSEVTRLGHLYHAYLRSGDRRYAEQARSLLARMQQQLDEEDAATPVRRAS